MQKQYKNLLRTLVTDLRHLLAGYWDADGQYYRGDLDRELERIGFAPDGAMTPLDALPHPTSHDIRAHRVAEAQLGPYAGSAQGKQAKRVTLRAELVERAAYSWINRLLALRAMEARSLIDETLRPNPAYDGIAEALFILRHTQPERAHGADGGWWAVLEDACTAQAQALPGLFDLADPNVALRPSIPTLLQCIKLVGGALPSAGEGQGEVTLDAVFRDLDAIGWAYQFYQEEAKNQVYAKLNRGGKVENRAEIAAATQLFTEPYMVQWLLQNSLGRTYHEAYPTSKLPTNWAYYIDPRKVNTREGSEQGIEGPDFARHAPHFTLASLTFLDPSMGSGHFLREAFDMLFAMYLEQHPDMPARAIAERILAHHLHGIDIDPRAAQLAAFTLYMRALELIRLNENKIGPHSALRAPHSAFTMNLATTPTRLDAGALERHLQHHPEDEIYKPVLVGLFAALEQAPILGSLLRPQEHLDEAINAFKQQRKSGQMGLMGEQATLNQLLEELGRHDPDELKRLLLDRIVKSFVREAKDSDVGAALLGREAMEGVHLLQLLDKKYAVVATNPPYMGSKNMDSMPRKYLEKFYKSGKRDLYAAFILRSKELCLPFGRVALIAQQTWMFLKSFADLRAINDERLSITKQEGGFTGVIRETSIEALAHLGRYAFSEIGNAAVAALMFIVSKKAFVHQHRIWSVRLNIPRPSTEQALLLQQASQQGANHTLVYTPNQQVLLSIPDSPIVYWAADDILKILANNPKLLNIANVVEGLGTRWDDRFLRTNAETPNNRAKVSLHSKRWFPFVKGGGYCKWYGLQFYSVDWQYNGARLLNFTDTSGKLRSRPQNIDYYFQSAFTYTAMAQGSLGIRKLSADTVAGDAGPIIFPLLKNNMVGLLNTRIPTYILRIISPTLQLKTGYVRLTPLPIEFDAQKINKLVTLCTKVKALELKYKLLEREFDPIALYSLQALSITQKLATLIHCCEAVLENSAISAYKISENTLNQILIETGIPVGWHPLIAGYDGFPKLPDESDVLTIPEEVVNYLANHERITLSNTEIKILKTNLRILYETGPGVKDVESESDNEIENEDEDSPTDEESIASDTSAPIPTETFWEGLSAKLQIHPISIYWLLEELYAEGVRCKPEEQRLLEDRLTVLVLRLLGHRWPKQIEAGEPVPPWADHDGVIPLTAGAGEETLAQRLRARLREQEGDLGAQRTEALLLELTGQSLETWLRKTFFKRHISQFKKRPVAWHLASKPQEGSKGARGKKQGARNREPAFECLVYYHATDTDLLARIRTQYVEPLIEAERRQLAQMRQATLLEGSAAPATNETAEALALARKNELEDFAARLRQVEETGFACAELEKLLTTEPLDRWSGDGIFAPASTDELLVQEQAWRVDINDGVRVNIAPLQAIGLLVSEVLNAPDMRKAIADRARWRSDERRWVRQGKLPRCGWMPEDVPESPIWTALAPQREAEQQRLAEKRKKALAELEDPEAEG